MNMDHGHRLCAFERSQQNHDKHIIYPKRTLSKTKIKVSSARRLTKTSWRNHWTMEDPWQYGLVVTLATCAYLNSLGGDLVHDDVLAITNNRDVHTNVTGVLQVFNNDFWGRDMRHEVSHKSYRPLCILTFRLNFWISGLGPLVYHVTNVFLHAACSALYLAFCRMYVFRFQTKWATLGAAMFAVHPIHTEAVAGVVGRADVLASILFLISLMSYISSLDTRRHLSEVAANGRLDLFVVCLVTGSAAMFAKETGITVFGVCLIYDVTVASHKGIKRYLSSRTLDKRCIHLVMRITIIFTLVMLLLAFRWHVMGGHLPPFTNQDNPAAFSSHLQTRILTYWYVYARNAQLMILPSVLSYDWQMGSIPLVSSLGDTRNLLSLTLIILLGCLSYLSLIKATDPERRRLVLGISILVIPFLPACNLFFTVGFVIAERILYLPSMGYIVLIVEGLQRLTATCPYKTESMWRRPAVLLCLTIVLGGMWTARTVIRNQVWQSRQHLFRSGLQTLPYNAKMHYNYGNLMKDTGQDEAAIRHYRTAIGLWPTYASAHNNLATLLENPTEAHHHYSEAIRIAPRHAGAFFNLGNLLIKQGRMEEAVSALQRSVSIDGMNADSHISLASALTKMARHVEAETHYARALTLRPQRADYHNNYGVFLNHIGRSQEALETYERAIQLNPQHHVAMVNAARMLRQLGQTELAENYLNRALAIDRDPLTLDYVGIFFFNQGQNDRALKLFKEALERNPNSTEARIHYAQALNVAGELESARFHLQAVLSSAPTHSEALRQMANVYGIQGDHEQAIIYLNLAIQSANDTDDLATLYFELGNQQKDLSLYSHALKSYEDAVLRNPSIAEAHLNLGVIYHLQGDYQQAMAHYRTAQTMLPNQQLLEANIKKLQRHLNKKEDEI